MVLKEAYCYQNYLSDLYIRAIDILGKKDFITTTKETHHRLSSDGKPVDEEPIVKPKNDNYDFTPTQLIDFLVKVVDEKERLADAISRAKHNTDIDIDTAISMNKVKHNVISALKKLADTKASESQSKGIDYNFDINNEQKQYRYTIDKVTTIDFDRNDVKNLIKKYTKETNEISNKLDVAQITTTVNFEPTWEMDMTLEDAVLS